MIIRTGIYVDGEWRESASSATNTVVDPHSEQPYAEVSAGDPGDAAVAAESAQLALKGEWSRTTLRDRIDIVLRVRDLLGKYREELATYATHTLGTPYQNSLYLGQSQDLIDMYVDSINQIELEYVRNDRFGSALISRRPVGVVAAIVPWNAPVRSEIKKVVPALLCGCTAVLKPAPETPLGAGLLAEIFTEAGLPPGVLNLVCGAAEVGEALVQHPDVRKIAFTGSTATGTRIAALAGPTVKRLQLELGGKSAAVLLEDVDLATMMPVLAMSAWANTGQACSANTRVIAPRARYEEVVEAYAAAAASEVVGDPMDRATTLGPLVSQRQWDRVMSYIELGKQEGAKLVTGGSRPGHPDSGYYVQPTVFADVDNGMRIAREEIFGPVTVIIPYDTEDDAVALANDSDLGLAGSVMGTDEERALSIARRIESGCVAVNGFLPPMSAPFGGVKLSGIGREHGPEGYDSFLEYATYRLTPRLLERLSGEFPAG